jgi:hypothetical protein
MRLKRKPVYRVSASCRPGGPGEGSEAFLALAVAEVILKLV